MKLLSTLKKEIGKAPIGTIGSICGVVTLMIDIAGFGQPLAGSHLTSQEYFAIALLKAIVISFIFSYIPAKFLESKRHSTQILYVVFSFCSALLINSQFAVHFEEKNTSGGFGDLVMIVIGLLLSAFYAITFIETSAQMRMSQNKYIAILVVGIIQTFTIKFGLYLPVFP